MHRPISPISLLDVTVPGPRSFPFPALPRIFGFQSPALSSLCLRSLSRPSLDLQLGLSVISKGSAIPSCTRLPAYRPAPSPHQPRFYSVVKLDFNRTRLLPFCQRCPAHLRSDPPSFPTLLLRNYVSQAHQSHPCPTHLPRFSIQYPILILIASLTAWPHPWTFSVPPASDYGYAEEHTGHKPPTHTHAVMGTSRSLDYGGLLWG